MSKSFALFALTLRGVDAFTACVYTCDKDWPALDTGICNANDCPSPDSSEVSQNICWGLPFEPSPGDIVQHEIVPFDSQDACDAYVQSWQTGGSQLSAVSTSDDSDLTSYSDRGHVFDTVMQKLLGHCVTQQACQNVEQGMTGKELRDCINECLVEIGETKGEEVICNAALDVETVGLASFFCNHGLNTIMQPVNNFFNHYIEQPIVEVADTVEGAIASAGRGIKHFLHFINPFAVVV